MNYKRANVSFDWDASTNRMTSVFLTKHPIETILKTELNKIPKNQGHPASTQRAFFFNKNIEDICNEVFDAIKEIKNRDKDDYIAAYLATRLFENFTSYWKELMNEGMFTTAITFWQEIISIARVWESKNFPIKIHKGTPFFFLASNCLQVGDRDNGFTYLYNAIEDDKKLPNLGYPDIAPAYMTATLIDNKKNFMYERVRTLRLRISKSLIEFKREFSPELTLKDFQDKFLRNKELQDTVYFFVYNLQYIYDQEKTNPQDILQNEFSRLRILSLFFNFGLIIDKILTLGAKNSGITTKTMYPAVQWWAENAINVTNTQLRTIVNTDLNLNSAIPDIIIPQLLQNIQNNQGGADKKLWVMLIAYKLRNHGGHNIDQQTVLTTNYSEILKQLFNALFLAVQMF